MATRYRWIMYISQDIPNNQAFDLERVESLSRAQDVFAEFRRAVMYEECSAALYAYSEDRWTLAERFRDAGCPFDYPDRLIETGPLGGVVVNHT